jgi:hypothetical protein
MIRKFIPYQAEMRKRGNSYQIDYVDPNGRRVRKSFKKGRMQSQESVFLSLGRIGTLM